ncbi:MAG TPA: M67 family metallopeptidase [Nitrospiria bacterium]|nr:M67 family metallopeptidase [Nitrospiria bacterium]
MVQIPKTIYEEMISHARSWAPYECCGLLGGRENRVEKHYPLTNIQKSPVSYMIDPKEQFKVFKDLRAQGTDLVAIYHSHPATEAYPSPTDVRLAYYPDSAYIIISLQNPEQPAVKGFRIVDQKISAEELEIIAR